MALLPKANLEAEARLTEKARGHVAGAFGEVGVRGDDAGRARACHLLDEGTHTSPPERRSSSVTSNPLAFFRNPLEPPARFPEMREAGPRRRPAAWEAPARIRTAAALPHILSAGGRG